MFRLLHALLHGTEALFYSNHPRDAAASTCLRAVCHRCTLVPLFNSGANAAFVSVQTLPVQIHYSAGTDVGRGSLETPTIVCYTLCVSRGMNGVTLASVTLGGYPTQERGAVFVGKNASLWIYPLTCPETPIARVKEKTRNNPPCLITTPSSRYL